MSRSGLRRLTTTQQMETYTSYLAKMSLIQCTKDPHRFTYHKFLCYGKNDLDTENKIYRRYETAG